MGRTARLLDDHMSENRSFDSNYRPSSQSRKISIGVVVDSSAKANSKYVKGAVAKLQTAENATPIKENFADKGQKVEEASAPTLKRQNKDQHQKTSPWFFTKTFYQRITSSDAIDHPNQVSSFLSNSHMLLQSSGRRIAAETHPVQLFANQTSILHAGDASEKKFARVTSQTKGRNDASREEESSNATAKTLLVPGKETAEQATDGRGNNGNETLRLKLQEILGTVSSPNMKQFNSKALVVDANNSKPASKTDQKDNPVPMCKPHSDTIETDSGSLDLTIRRPATRSLTRKKPQAKISAGRKKGAPFCRSKQAPQVKNEFCFVDGWSQRLSAAVNRASTVYKRKECEIKSSGLDPDKTFFTQQRDRGETQQTTARRKAKAASENTPLLEIRTVNFIDSHAKNTKKVEAKNEAREKVDNQLKTTMIRDQPGDSNMPMSQVNAGQQDPSANPSLNNSIDPKSDPKSPTFELKTDMKISSPSSLPLTNQEDLDVDSPPERAFNREENHSFNSLGTSKGRYCNANTKSLPVELRDSCIATSAPLMNEGHKDNRLSGSLSEKVGSESSESGSPITGSSSELLPETGTAENPKFVLHLAKRLRIEKGVAVSKFTPGTASQKGHILRDEDSEEFDGVSEQDGEDGLTSAVALFALALKRVESKIHTAAGRRTADILMSVSKNIRLQLQNAESQIQNEIGKLSSLGNSKRKRLENQYQEQQKQLKHICERFKEELDQHLQNCRSTLEGLEAHRVEVKGIVEKQRLSHRKLLLETEKAIEIQLDEARKRLVGVNRQAREKTLQLKYGIGECLKEGILS